MRERKRTRRGFALLWVVVGAMVFVALVAATAPLVVAAVDQQRVVQAATTLLAIDSAITGSKGFFLNVDTTGATGNYPGALRDLANPIVAGTNADHNSCGTTGSGHTHRYSAVDTTGWRNTGPFVNFAIGTGGVSTPIGVALDSIKRDTIAGSQYLRVNIINVLQDDVTRLDNIIDAGNGAGAGAVRWAAAATAGFDTLKFEIGPITATQC